MSVDNSQLALKMQFGTPHAHSVGQWGFGVKLAFPSFSSTLKVVYVVIPSMSGHLSMWKHKGYGTWCPLAAESWLEAPCSPKEMTFASNLLLNPTWKQIRICPGAQWVHPIVVAGMHWTQRLGSIGRSHYKNGGDHHVWIPPWRDWIRGWSPLQWCRLVAFFSTSATSGPLYWCWGITTLGSVLMSCWTRCVSPGSIENTFWYWLISSLSFCTWVKVKLLF